MFVAPIMQPVTMQHSWRQQTLCMIRLTMDLALAIPNIGTWMWDLTRVYCAICIPLSSHGYVTGCLYVCVRACVRDC